MTSGSEGSNKDPIKWILQGSKDDNIWVPLDSVGYDKIVAFKTRYEKQNFQVSDTARYAFFRLLLTSATTSVHIGGLELFGDYKSVAVPSYMLSFTATPVSFVDRLLGARSYKESETVQIIAGKSSGFYFHGWTGSDQDVALLANPLADTTTFSMPNRAVSFKANFSRTPNVDIQSAQSSLIKLFPNPVKNELNISGLSKSDFVNIFNSAGVKMKIKTGSVINVAGLPKGKYLVSINTPQGVVRKSFLKE